jgi:hypothetical protein
MFGEIICNIFSSTSPVDDELTLCNVIFDPVESHDNCFGAALFDGVIGKAGDTGNVSLDQGCGLWITHIFKGGLEPGAACSYFLFYQKSAPSLALDAEDRMAYMMEQLALFSGGSVASGLGATSGFADLSLRKKMACEQALGSER